MEDLSKAESRILEKSAWDEIITTNGWFVFIDLIKERQKDLQKIVNKCLREENFTKAGQTLAKMDEYTKLVKLAKARIKDFNKGEVQDD